MIRELLIWALVGVGLVVGGCQTLAGNPSLTAEQLKAMSADKNFTAFCTNIVGPAGAGKAVYANVDRTVVVNGSISVAPDCTITMSNEATPPVTK